jgi:hypothetical protein
MLRSVLGLLGLLGLASLSPGMGGWVVNKCINNCSNLYAK